MKIRLKFTYLVIAIFFMACQKDVPEPVKINNSDLAFVTGVIECSGSAGGDSAFVVVAGQVFDRVVTTTPGGTFKLSAPPNTSVLIRFVSSSITDSIINITTGATGSIYELGSIHLCGSTNGIKISAGNGCSFFVKPDGTLWSCGSNNPWGQLGLGTPLFVPRLSPTQIGTDNNWYEVAASVDANYALKTNGNSYAFGLADYCGLGIFSYNPSSPVLNGVNVSSVNSGPANNCWLIKQGSGQLQAFGYINPYSPPSGVTNFNVLLPMSIGILMPYSWKHVVQDGSGAYAINESGTLWHTMPLVDSVLSQVGTDTWLEITQGFALRSDGTIWKIISGNWQQVGSDNDWIKVSCWTGHCMAIKSDGTLWGWGDNTYGQVGDTSSASSYYASPIQIGTDHDWADVSAGATHTIATKNNGSVWAWGQNGGNLGTGDTDDHHFPVQIYF